MRKLCASSLFLAGVLSLAVFAWAQSGLSRYDYIGRAANAVVQASLKGANLSLSEFNESMSMACSAMTRLSNDEEFFKVAGDKDLSSVTFKVFDDVSYLASFLDFERETLLEMGVSETTAEILVSHVALLARGEFSTDTTPEDIRDRILAIRDTICTLREQSASAMKNVERWAIVHRVARGLGGAAIAVANTYAAAPTVGFSQLSMLVASAYLGSAL